MKNQIKPGLKYSQTYETTNHMRAPQLSHADVFSTPSMIGLMEGTCVRLTAPFLDEGENSVGMHVDVHHLAPTKIGQSVTVTAEILEIAGNKIRYGVSAVNDAGVIFGEGTHGRGVIRPKMVAGDRP